MEFIFYNTVCLLHKERLDHMEIGFFSYQLYYTVYIGIQVLGTKCHRKHNSYESLWNNYECCPKV